MDTHRRQRFTCAIAALLACLLLPAGAAAAPDLAILAKASESPGAVRDRIYTFDPISGAFNPLVSTGQQFLSLQSFAWQPDGEAVAFVATVAVTGSGAATVPRSEIWTVRRTGGGLRRLGGGEAIGQPTFSPDGKRIAFVSRFKRRSGRGCARGGYAVAVVNVARAKLGRVSACFNSRLARSAVAFVDGNRAIAAVVNRREIVRIAASGSNRTATKPRVIHRAATGDRVAITSYVPRTKSLWLRYDTADTALLRIGARRAKLLPTDTFDVAPNGRIAIGNCAALPERGLCAFNISTRKRARIDSPFPPDLSRDSLEFGFAFDAQSQRLASFGHPEFGLDGLPTGTRICVRAKIEAVAACSDLPAGVAVADLTTGIARWRPAT